MCHFFVRCPVARVVSPMLWCVLRAPPAWVRRSRGGEPRAPGPGWSGGWCPCPGPVPSRPACGRGGFEGFVPPFPVWAAGRLRVPLTVCPRRAVPPVAGRLPTLGARRRTSSTHRLLPEGRPVRSAACRARSVGVGMVGMCPARCGASWTGAGDRWQMMSVGPAGRWGLHGLCPYLRGRQLAVLREAVCGCAAGTAQGNLSPGAVLARRPTPLGCEGCLGSFEGRMVGGGSRMCRRGNPPRVAAPAGVLGSSGVPFAWRLRDFLGLSSPVSRGVSLVARGFTDGPMLCLCMAVRMQDRRWCHGQCSPFISSGL